MEKEESLERSNLGSKFITEIKKKEKKKEEKLLKVTFKRKRKKKGWWEKKGRNDFDN